MTVNFQKLSVKKTSFRCRRYLRYLLLLTLVGAGAHRYGNHPSFEESKNYYNNYSDRKKKNTNTDHSGATAAAFSAIIHVAVFINLLSFV